MLSFDNHEKEHKFVYEKEFQPPRLNNEVCVRI